MLILRQTTTNAEVLFNAAGLWVKHRGGEAGEVLAKRLNAVTTDILDQRFRPGDPMTTNAIGEAVAAALPDIEVSQRAEDEFVEGRLY